MALGPLKIVPTSAWKWVGTRHALIANREIVADLADGIILDSNNNLSVDLSR